MMERKSSRLARMFQFLLGVVLVWASLSKLGDVQSFYGSVLTYQLPLPQALLRIVAICLPWLELFCGLMLVANIRADAALLVAGILFAGFTVATGQAWYRGQEISCGCLDLRVFGLAEESGMSEVINSVQFAFWRAVIFLCLSCFLLRRVFRVHT